MSCHGRALPLPSLKIELKAEVQDTVVRRVHAIKPDIDPQKIKDATRSKDGGEMLIKQLIMDSSEVHEQVADGLRDATSFNSDVLMLEENVLALKEMFNDMAFLVEQQGELLSQIEHNVSTRRKQVMRLWWW